MTYPPANSMVVQLLLTLAHAYPDASPSELAVAVAVALEPVTNPADFTTSPMERAEMHLEGVLR